MGEMIDVFDGNYTHIGVFERNAAHRQGLWHQTCHFWIVRSDDTGQYMLLQLRSKEKRNYPDMLDITAAGHLLAGETPNEGVRELQEEIGLNIEDLETLKYLGIKHDVMDEPNGVRNREFAHIYLAREDRKIEQYQLQESEVSGLVQVPLGEGIELFNGEIDSIQCNAVRLEEGVLRTGERVVRREDLIPRVDNYYLKMFLLGRQLLAGEMKLSV